MTAIQVNLPESLLKAAQAFAERDNTTLEQVMMLALAEKLSAVATADYLAERAKRGSREKFEAVLANIPDVEPEDYDRLD